MHAVYASGEAQGLGAAAVVYFARFIKFVVLYYDLRRPLWSLSALDTRSRWSVLSAGRQLLVEGLDQSLCLLADHRIEAAAQI